MDKNFALNLREVADKANEEKDLRKLQVHQEFVETKVLPYLQENAEDGRYKVSFPTPGYSHLLVRDLLRKAGFTVDVFTYNKTHYLLAQW